MAQLAANPDVKAYLTGRGFTPKTIATWGLGYAPEGWTNLIQHARTKGVEPEALKLAGLARSKDGGFYDLFRNRVTIPIKDERGLIVGFSTRTLGDDKPKYVNTPQTEVFHKSKLLFGLDRAKATIRETSDAVLAEGQLDVIALHQDGCMNAVGAMSSTLTAPQIETLERLKVKRLYTSFDSDKAGEEATLTTLNAVQGKFDAFVVNLDGKDPAEMVQKDPGTFAEALKAAQNEAEYRYTTALRDVDPRTKQGRDLFLERLKPGLGDAGMPGSGAELRQLAVTAIGADVTTADLKAFAGSPELTIDAQLEVAEDAKLRRQVVRDKVAGELEPFPLEVYPAALREYVKVCAAALPVPPDFVGVPMLCALATAIGHSREIVIKKSWHEGALFYAAIVGDAGSRKTAALSKANDPIYRFQDHFEKQHKTDLEAYHAQQQDYEDAKGNRKGDRAPQRPGDEPEMRQIMTTDATREAVITLHAKNERSLLLCQDELSGWVGGMNQYKGGKGNDKQFWLSNWSRERVMSNRKGKAAETIAKPQISVSGGIQPDILPTLQTEQGADGFIDRILFSYPHAVKAKDFDYDDDVSEEHVAGYRKVMGVLWRLEQAETADGPRPKPLQMTDEAKVAFKNWMDEHNADKEKPGLDSRLKGVWSKFDGYCARFALVLHLTAYAASEETDEKISEHSVQKATALIEYFKSHAQRVYRQLGDNPEDKLLNTIYEYINDQPKRRCAVRDLQRANLYGCKTTAAIKAQLQKLTDAGLGTLEPFTHTNGRKGEEFVLSAGTQDAE